MPPKQSVNIYASEKEKVPGKSKPWYAGMY